jgi:hypothetical protein
MHKKTKTALIVLLILVACGAFWFFRKPPIQVIGNLPPKDLGEIQRLVRGELRESSFATLSVSDFFRHPRFWLNQFKEYNSQRILWIRVAPDGKDARVVVGVSKARIGSEGYDYMVHKDAKWWVNGSAYWGDPQVAPSDLRIPPP